MSTKKRKEFLLSEEDLNYIEEVKNKNNFKYPGEALTLIINEHKGTTNQSVAAILIEEISNLINTELKRNRVINNKTNRNTEVLLELMNGICIKESYSPFFTREEKYHEGLKEIEDTVDKNIIRQSTVKWDNNY